MTRHRSRSRRAGRRRLALDELLDLQLMLARARHVAKRGRSGVQFKTAGTSPGGSRSALPWPLTADQRQAMREIVGDMTAPERMHRLLMGDVGTGKTVVALFAMLVAVENGYQAALMAPTELLAEQHLATLSRLLEPLEIRPGLLVGQADGARKANRPGQLGVGARPAGGRDPRPAAGHVAFQRLGLVVIDEQHRFGVEQRAALMGKGDVTDVLLLSATPIPRSLALTRYGDLDLRLLKDPTPGPGDDPDRGATRQISERGCSNSSAAVLGGGQAYVVLPVIDETEKADLRAARPWPKGSGDVAGPGGRAGAWPAQGGGAGPGDAGFPRAGEIRVLVATTVIEVGIDVPMRR